MKMNYLLHHLFFDSEEKYSEKIAVKDNYRTLTYHELFMSAGYLSERLLDYGVKRGDRVAFFLPHTVDQAIAILAISSSGAVFVPINHALFPAQVAHILKDSGSSLLITNSELLFSIQDYIKDCQTVKTIINVDELEGNEPLKRSSYCIENDLACLLYTSGSTGSPKGVMFSHKNIISGFSIVSDYLGLTSDDRVLGILQLSFDYGLNQLITMLALGGTYRFLSYRFPEEIVRTLQDDNITGLAGVPQNWIFLMRSKLAETQLPHLRYITNSGGQIPDKTLTFLRNALPKTKIVLMYGLTEAFRSTFLNPSDLNLHPTSIGKPIPDTEIFVVSEDGKMCGPNEAGELVHRGPTVTLGYWNKPDETALKFRKLPFQNNKMDVTEKVVYSGDLVRYDDEGFLYFIGRKDGMIKSYGIRVSPTEIEEVLYKYNIVHEAAAVGVQDPVAGQLIKVFIVLKDIDAGKLEEIKESLICHCTDYLPQYMIPRQIEIVESLPKTPHGKIDYPALKK